MIVKNRKCWQCGNGVISELCLTSDPPQYQLRCSACDYMHTQPDPHGTDWEPEKQATEPTVPNLEALTKELGEWCKARGVVIVPVAVGRKTGQLANITDWEPDSHIFSHALAPRQQ